MALEVIRVVIGGRGRPAKIVEVENTLDSFQALVEGYVEYLFDSSTGIGCYVNEDGRMKYLTEKPIVFLGIAIVGPIVVFGARKSNPQSLTPEQAEEIVLNLARWS